MRTKEHVIPAEPLEWESEYAERRKRSDAQSRSLARTPAHPDGVADDPQVTADTLFAWGQIFEKSGMRARLHARCGDAEVPVAWGSVEVPEPRPRTLKGELRILLHGCDYGHALFCYAEMLDGQPFKLVQSIGSARRLQDAALPSILKQMHVQVVGNGGWHRIGEWVSRMDDVLEPTS
jgi:hypothetical protein